MRYKNIAGRFFGLVTKHACDGQTDRITTPKNRASIAASRGKNVYVSIKSSVKYSYLQTEKMTLVTQIYGVLHFFYRATPNYIHIIE